MNKITKLFKRGFIVKAVVFRKNLPVLIDWCKRLNEYTYILKSTKHHFPSPPSNDYVHIINGATTIYLYSPRIGTYFYLKTPETEINDNEDLISIKYGVKREVKKKISKDETKTETLNIVEATTIPLPKPENKDINETITTSMELFDHDDRNFQINDIEITENKYKKEVSWWKEHGAALLIFVGFVCICIGIYIVYSQIVFPSAQYALPHSIQVTCTNQTITSGAI